MRPKLLFAALLTLGLGACSAPSSRAVAEHEGLSTRTVSLDWPDAKHASLGYELSWTGQRPCWLLNGSEPAMVSFDAGPEKAVHFGVPTAFARGEVGSAVVTLVLEDVPAGASSVTVRGSAARRSWSGGRSTGGLGRGIECSVGSSR